MIIVTVAALLVWRLLRHSRKKYSLVILLMVTVNASFIVINDVRTAGTFWEETTPDYDIVYYNSLALFPFVIQKHQNWSAREYFHQVLLLWEDGVVVYKAAPRPDQSEYMHWSLFIICTTLCALGFLLAVGIVVVAELIWWYRLHERE